MKSIVNNRGIKVEIGKWYKVFNLNSGMATETWKVTGFILNPDGSCYGVSVQGRLWFDKSTRWINWICEELL